MQVQDVTSLLLSIKEANPYNKTQQRKLLREISDLFRADFIYIIIRSPANIGKSRTYYIHNLETNNKIRHTLSGVARETIDKDKVLVVKDYKRYIHAVKEWIDFGVTSLISFPIRLPNTKKVIGVFQVVFVNHTVNIREEWIAVGKLIAKELGAQLYWHYYSVNMNLFKKKKTIDLYFSDKFCEVDNITKDVLIAAIKVFMDEFNITTFSWTMPFYDINVEVKKEPAYHGGTPLYRLVEGEENVEAYKKWREILYEPKYKKGKYVSMQNLEYGEKYFVPILHKGEIVSVIGFEYKDNLGFAVDYMETLKSIGENLVKQVIMHNKRNIKGSINSNFNSLMRSIMRLVEMRDTYTKGHSERVGMYSKKIGEFLGLSRKTQDDLYLAGLLHDIGKIGIPDHILLKPGKLSRYEYKVIKYHPILSYLTVKETWGDSEMTKWIRHHHERCDGRGYPDGLKCEEIELGAKILAIADVFDALTSKRVYRSKEKFSVDEAKTILLSSGLDDEILIRIEDKLLLIYEYGNSSNEIPHTYIVHMDKLRKNIFNKDYFTGSYKIEALYSKIDKLIKSERRFSLSAIDVVRMSEISKAVGYDVSSNLIKTISSCLSSMPEVVIASRLGYDSFMFISTRHVGSPGDIVKRLESKIIERMEGNPIIKKALFKGFHHGHATFPEDADDRDGLIYACIANLKDSGKK